MQISSRFVRYLTASLGPVLLAFSLTACGEDNPEKSAEARPRLRAYAYGTKIFFNIGGDSERFRLAGWSTTEHDFTWTDGIGASLSVRVPRSKGPLTLDVYMAGMNHLPSVPFQPVDVSINGHKLADWEVLDDKVYSVAIPKEFADAPESLLTIDFYIPQATSPQDLGLGSDWRRLGLRLRTVEIVETPDEGRSAPPDRPAGEQ